MPEQEQYELGVRNRLAEAIVGLDELEEHIRMYLADPLRGSQPFGFVELMKRLSELLRQCHVILRAHADGTKRVSDDLLHITSTTIRSVDELLSALSLAAQQKRLLV